MSSRACPAGAPPVTSLRPSRLATSMAGAPAVSPGTAIPAGGSTPLSAEAALIPSVLEAAAAARTAPRRNASRRLVLPVIVIVLPDSGRRSAPAGELICRGPDLRSGRVRWRRPSPRRATQPPVRTPPRRGFNDRENLAGGPIRTFKINKLAARRTLLLATARTSAARAESELQEIR